MKLKKLIILLIVLLTACEMSTDESKSNDKNKQITIEESYYIGIGRPIDLPKDSIGPSHGSKVTKPPAGGGED